MFSSLLKLFKPKSNPTNEQTEKQPENQENQTVQAAESIVADEKASAEPAHTLTEEVAQINPTLDESSIAPAETNKETDAISVDIDVDLESDTALSTTPQDNNEAHGDTVEVDTAASTEEIAIEKQSHDEEVEIHDDTPENHQNFVASEDVPPVSEEVVVVEEIIHIQTKSDIETSWTFGGTTQPESSEIAENTETTEEIAESTVSANTSTESHWTYGGANLHEAHETIQIDPSKLTPQTKALIDEALGLLPESRAALVGKLDNEPVAETETAAETVENETANTEPETWASGMAHAIADKAEELEMRGEILVEEVTETVKELAHKAEDWAEGMAHAIADKADELEMRGEIVVQETVQAVKESIETLEHTLDDTPQPELLPETETASEAEPEIAQPPAAEAATELDENEHDTLPEKNNQPAENHVANLNDVPLMAASAATVLASDRDEDEPETLSWTERLTRGLSKSRNQMAKSLAGVFGGGKIDEDLYEELETVLITSDMGIEATEHLMNEVRKRVSLKGLKDGNELRQALKDAVYDLLKPLEQPLVLPENGKPFVIMMAGINGAGKTTSIGKLAKYFQSQGKSVMLAAGDTFRAAAREQLQEWGKRNNVTVISQAKGDSAAVCFDAVESAKAKGIDIVLADTAGRLPTQLHLMEEIAKVKRVLQKAMPDAPHEIMLVLDANIGQNALNQVEAFDKALGVTGLIVTKLDGSAKGGVLGALASNHTIPVRYIGVGESIDDLRPFKARDFVDALLGDNPKD